MGFWFRKTLFSLGPFRLTLNKRGISASVGVPGLHAGIGSSGPYVSSGAKGLRFLKRIGRRK